MPAAVSTWREPSGVGGAEEHVAHQVGHRELVAVGLVGLEHRELGAVRGVDALVAEDPAHLEDPVDPADDGLLEVQLQGDAQRHLLVEGVDVGLERPGRGAAVDQLEHGRLDLDVALASSRVCADGAQRSRPGCGPCRGPPGGRSGRRSAGGPASPRRAPCAAPAAGAAPWTPSPSGSAMTDSSPRREEMTRPSTKTWSPRSTCAFQSASASSPTSARLSITCSRVPTPSWRVAKQSLPVLRMKTTRPATPTTSWVSSPVSRWPHCSRTCSSVCVRRHRDRVGLLARRRAAARACRGAPASARGGRCRGAGWGSRSPPKGTQQAGEPRHRRP